MTHPMDDLTQCAVKGCTNRQHEGLFVGFLCSPCHTFISTGEGDYSQAFRNMREAIKQAVEDERGAIAAEFEKRHEALKHRNNYWLHAANHVRARSQA